MSEMHFKACGAKEVNENRGLGPIDIVMVNLGEKHIQVMIRLFDTVYYINKKEQPFLSLPSLLQLQAMGLISNNF